MVEFGDRFIRSQTGDTRWAQFSTFGVTH